MNAINKTETCSCGKNFINNKDQPKNRIQMICHCDTCGKKFGEHFKDKDDIELWKLVKLYCVACGTDIKPNLTRYKNFGNYCHKCNSICGERAKYRIKDGQDLSFNNLFKIKR